MKLKNKTYQEDYPRFYKNLGPFNLKQIKEFLNAEVLSKDQDYLINDFKSIESAGDHEIAFINDNYKYNENKISASTLLASKGNSNSFDDRINIIKVDNLHLSISILSNIFYEEFDAVMINSLNKHTFIGEPDHLDDSALISNGVVIGKNANIKSGVSIGYNCKIGNNVTIGNNSVISNAIIGDNVNIGRNCSIGQPGFGFALNNFKNSNIYHKGCVIIQDNVQIGSNCCFDRGSFGQTIIGENTYFDNLCHVAHNVQVGNNCIFAAMTGIAGSAKIGNFVFTGGQVGIGGHLNVGNNVQIAAQSGVFNDADDNSSLMGSPAINKFTFLKSHKKRYERKN